MTISSSNRKNTYSGTGSLDTFAYTFRILSDSGILVQIKDSAGTITNRTLTTHYTVTGAGSNSGGNVVFTAGNIPSATDTVVLTRNMPFLQETDFVENDPLPAESIEEALDELTMTDLQLLEGQDRTIKIDSAVSGFDTTLPTPVASKFVQINASANGFALGDDTSILSSLSKSDGTFYVGDGTTVVAETGATARSSMGLGTSDSPTFSDLTLSGDMNVSDTKGVKDGNGNELLTFGQIPSAVNNLKVINSATGVSPALSSQGEAEVGMRLLDSGSNTILELDASSSPVNFLSLVNSATGSGPKLEAKGTDSNVDIQIQPKGTGSFAILGTSSQSAHLELREDTDNGTNYGRLTVPSSVTTSFTLTLPEVTDTLVARTDTATLTNKTLTSPVINTGVSGTAILDEDTMSSNSATHLATQQSIKAYVDAQVASGKLVQYVLGESTTDDTTTSTSFSNTSLSATITPTNGTNRIVAISWAPVRSHPTGSAANNRFTDLDIRRTTGTATTIGASRCGQILAAAESSNAESYDTSCVFGSEISPGTSAHTYVLRFAAGSTQATSSVQASTRGRAWLLLLELEV